MSPLIVPVTFFAFLAIVILGLGWMRHRGRKAGLAVVTDAMSKGVQLDAAIIDRLMERGPAPVGKWFVILSLFFGALALAVGIGLGAAAIFLGDSLGEAAEPGNREGMLVGALINLCTGISYITLGVVGLRRFSGKTRPSPKWDYGTGLALVCLFFGAGGLGVGIGLTLGATQFASISASGAAGMMVGALINLSTGVALTVLGVFIFRLFGEKQEG
jgi:hypothetical protein